MTFTNFLPVFSIALSLLIIAGGFVAFRQGYSVQSTEIQKQTIEALKVRVETLEGQTASDAREIARLQEKLRKSEQLMSAVRHALALRGLHIETDDAYVTLIDAEGQRSTQVPNAPKVIRSVKLQPVQPTQEEDDAS